MGWADTLVFLGGVLTTTAVLMLRKQRRSRRVPIYIMVRIAKRVRMIRRSEAKRVQLPLDIVHESESKSELVLRADAMSLLDQLCSAPHVTGVSVDVWWGLCEPEPTKYRWDGYTRLFDACRERGLSIQAILSFHACGGSVGDDVHIPLPAWVRGRVWYEDADGDADEAYVSLWARHVALDGQRQPSRVYEDFMRAFSQAHLGVPGISHVFVGCGPCGEARYPAYRLDQWRFPGIGALQCYDPHARDAWSRAQAHVREDAAMPACARYNAQPPTGEDMDRVLPSRLLAWYASELQQHAVGLVRCARRELGPRVRLGVKVPGIHWHSAHPSRAAEYMCGLLHPDETTPYQSLLQSLAAAGCDEVDFTCLEMADHDQPAHAHSRPFTLVCHVNELCNRLRLHMSGENALFTTKSEGEPLMTHVARLHGTNTCVCRLVHDGSPPVPRGWP